VVSNAVKALSAPCLFACVWEADTKETEDDALMLLVSGLSLGDPHSDPLATDLLVDFITGNLGGYLACSCLRLTAVRRCGVG